MGWQAKKGFSTIQSRAHAQQHLSTWKRTEVRIWLTSNLVPRELFYSFIQNCSSNLRVCFLPPPLHPSAEILQALCVWHSGHFLPLRLYLSDLRTEQWMPFLMPRVDLRLIYFAVYVRNTAQNNNWVLFISKIRANYRFVYPLSPLLPHSPQYHQKKNVKCYIF